MRDWLRRFLVAVESINATLMGIQSTLEDIARDPGDKREDEDEPLDPAMVLRLKMKARRDAWRNRSA